MTSELQLRAVVVGYDYRGNPLIRLEGNPPVYLIFNPGSGKVTRLELEDLLSLERQKVITFTAGVVNHAARS